MLRTAALTYGAQGGLAARSFAINEMLRRYQAQLDSAYDFGALVLPVGRRPDADAPADRLGRADGLCARRWRPGRTRNLVHLPDHARGAARLHAAELAHLSRARLGQSAPANRCHAAPHQAGGGLLEQVGGGRLGAGREAGRRDLPLRSRPAGARHRGHGALPRAAAGRSCRTAQASPSRTSGSMVGATACMSATRPSASPTSPACRAIRAAGCQARDARNEPSCAAWPVPQAN